MLPLRGLIGDLIKVRKRKEFIRRNEKEVTKNKNGLISMHTIHGFMPAIFRDDEESSRKGKPKKIAVWIGKLDRHAASTVHHHNSSEFLKKGQTSQL